MTGPNKKLTRRDAIKLLGAAAGATALANLPSKWSKPELVSGVLPAHAQTSCLGIAVEYTITCTDGGLNYTIFLDSQLIDSGSLVVDELTTGSIECEPGCLQIVTSAIGSGLIQVNRFSQAPINHPFTGSGFVLVNLTTGQYSTTLGQPAGNCFWT